MLVSHDYEYYGSRDKAVKVSDLIAKFKDEVALGETVLIKASDGFEKNEKLDIFQKGFIKYTGADAPAFMAPDMPKGMHVKNIMWFSTGKTVFCSAENIIDSIHKGNEAGKGGISLGQVFKETGLSDSPLYILSASDGFEVKISADRIKMGCLCFTESKCVSLLLNGPDEEIVIKGLLTVKTAEFAGGKP